MIPPFDNQNINKPPLGEHENNNPTGGLIQRIYIHVRVPFSMSNAFSCKYVFNTITVIMKCYFLIINTIYINCCHDSIGYCCVVIPHLNIVWLFRGENKLFVVFWTLIYVLNVYSYISCEWLVVF